MRMCTRTHNNNSNIVIAMVMIVRGSITILQQQLQLIAVIV